MDIKYQPSTKLFKFGKSRFLTYSEALSLKLKYETATAQLFPNEKLEVV
mgnify:FL=1|jgi:hypothetical protein